MSEFCDFQAFFGHYTGVVTSNSTQSKLRASWNSLALVLYLTHDRVEYIIYFFCMGGQTYSYFLYGGGVN